MIYKCCIVIMTISFLLSCTPVKNKDIEIIPIDLDEISTNCTMIKKIDLIPLETSEKGLIDEIRKIMYIPDLKKFVIKDKNNVISIFTEDGFFCLNSQDLMGDAPYQYNSIVDFSYNEYTETIDILTIYGEIKSYDCSFNFKGYKKISIDKGYIPSKFMAIDSSTYVISPTINQNENIFFLDVENQNVKMSHYKELIANVTMDVNSFYSINNKYYFIPRGINYYFYEIDKIKKEISPIIYLDFGREIINIDKLPGNIKFGEYDSKHPNVENYFKEMEKRDNYLVNSNYYLPIIKFFNDEYVYIHAIKKRKAYNFIYNRINKEYFTQTEDTPFPMRFCLGIYDDILYTYINPYDIEKYCNTDLITPESKERIAKVQEEDNIIIVKYHLK